MAVTRLGKGAGNRAASSSATLGTSWTSFSIAASDANTVAIVLVNGSISTNAATTVAVTYGGVAMTALSLVNYGTTSTTRGFVGIYYLYNPGTGAKTVAITTSGATKTALAGIDVSFSGVDTTIGSAQTATTTTHSVTSVANGYSLRVLSNGVTTGTLNQTSEYAAGSSVTGVGDFIAVQSAVGTGSNISFTASGTASTPNSVGVALSPFVPGAAISTLADDFDTGSTPDAVKWTIIGGTPTVTSGQLSISSASFVNDAIRSIGRYDLTGDAIKVQVTSTGAGVYMSFQTIDQSHYYAWLASGSNFYPWHDGTFISGSATAHTNGNWYRIREASGIIYYDWSADGVNWTNAYSAATITSINGLYVQLSANSVTGTALLDNFNTAPPPPGNTGAFFAMF